MNAVKSIELLRKYNKCKDCGSDAIGNGAGSVEILDDTFKRACKCGWGIEVKENGGVVTETHPDGPLSPPEIVEMHQNGTLCEKCGEFIGEPVGEPRVCVCCEE